MKKHLQSYNEFIHQKAVELLNFLDNPSPNKAQLNAIEQLIRCWVIPIGVGFTDNLTPRERSCLWYAAKGFSINKTADIMNISVNTVKTYRENILKKLYCTSILEAIIKSGFILKGESLSLST